MTYGAESEHIAEDAALDINNDVRDFFLGLASFPKHVEAQEENLDRYTASMALLLKNGVELASSKHSSFLFILSPTFLSPPFFSFQILVSEPSLLPGRDRITL